MLTLIDRHRKTLKYGPWCQENSLERVPPEFAGVPDVTRRKENSRRNIELFQQWLGVPQCVAVPVVKRNGDSWIRQKVWRL